MQMHVAAWCGLRLKGVSGGLQRPSTPSTYPPEGPYPLLLWQVMQCDAVLRNGLDVCTGLHLAAAVALVSGTSSFLVFVCTVKDTRCAYKNHQGFARSMRSLQACVWKAPVQGLRVA